MAFEVDPRSVSKESLKLTPAEGAQKPQKQRFEAGDKCVYPSEVSVMELKKRKKGLVRAHTHTHTHTLYYAKGCATVSTSLSKTVAINSLLQVDHNYPPLHYRNGNSDILIQCDMAPE